MDHRRRYHGCLRLHLLNHGHALRICQRRRGLRGGCNGQEVRVLCCVVHGYDLLPDADLGAGVGVRAYTCVLLDSRYRAEAMTISGSF